MTKEDLATHLYNEQLTETKAAGARVVESIFNKMASSLQSGEDIRLHGFGTFKVKQRDARVARNPKTGDPIDVPAKKVVGFAAASTLKQAVDQ